MTPFKTTKGTVVKAASACPASPAGRGTSSRARSRMDIFSGLDWFPTLMAAAGNPDITEQLLAGVKLGDRYLQESSGRLQPDGLAQGRRAIQAARALLLRRAAPWRGAPRRLSSSSSISSLGAGPAEKVTTTCPPWSTFVRIRLSGRRSIRGESPNNGAGGYVNDFFAREFWRFVLVQQEVESWP